MHSVHAPVIFNTTKKHSINIIFYALYKKIVPKEGEDLKLTNYERIKSLSLEEMAQEIKAIANWNRKEKRKAEQDEEFYIKWLNAEAPDDKCKVMDSDYCKNEYPIGKEAREKEVQNKIERIDVSNLNKIADENGLLSSRRAHHEKGWEISSMSDRS